MKKITIAVLALGCIIQLNAQVQTLKESIYFGLGKTSLSSEHKAKLDSILILLKSSKSYTGEIKGHTCSIGSMSINKIVSNLRALNVYNYLVDKGVNKDNFTYIGLGSSHPQSSNQTAAGRVKNRRADVDVLLSLSDEPSASTGANSNSTHDLTSSKESSKLSSEFIANRKNYKSSKKSKKGSNNSKVENAATTGDSKLTTSDQVTTTNEAAKTTMTEVAPVKETVAPPTELGPEFTSGKLPAAGNLKVTSSNGIIWEIDKNTFITTSKEPIDVDFKDYTKNGEIIRKGLQTKGSGKEYKLLGAFNVNFTQEYQDLAINSRQPLKVIIPGEYDENIALYSNHKNWTRDTINQLSYDDYRKAYVVSVVNNTQMIALMKPVAAPTEKTEYIMVKINGVKPDHIKPYVIYDDCTISNGYNITRKCFIFTVKKWFIFPITKRSGTYRLRAAYTDYSSKTGQPYSLNYDIVNLDKQSNLKTINEGGKMMVQYPKTVEMTNDKLPVSALCEMNVAVDNNSK